MSTNKQFLNMERQVPRLPRLGMIIAAFLLGLVLLILLDAWSRSKHLVSPIEILLGTPAGPSQDVNVVDQDGITVYMPANATDLEGGIFIAVAEPNVSLVVDNTAWMLLKVVNVEFRRPDGASVPGVSFSVPVDICFDLTEEQWQGFTQKADSFQVQRYNNQKSPAGWEILPQLTHPDRFQLCGQTSQLSLFGLAMKAEAGIPVTGSGFGITLGSVAAVPSAEARERRERDHSEDAPAVQAIPTNPLPTDIPPTQAAPMTDPPATEVPPSDSPQTQPPTDPPPAESPNSGGNNQGNQGNGGDNQGNQGNGGNNQGNHGNGGGNQGDHGNGNGKDKDKKKDPRPSG